MVNMLCIEYNGIELFPPQHMPKAIMDADFQKEVIDSSLPVLIDFWAPWCGPCKAMNPVLDELEKEYAGKATFVKMNVDENTDVPGQHNVMSIPTFIFYKNGKAVTSVIGARSKADMKKELDSMMAA